MHTQLGTPGLLLVLFVPLLLIPFSAHAASVVWNKDLGKKSYDWKKPAKGMHVDLHGIEMSVKYNVEVTNRDTNRVLSQNATVPFGTKLAFRFIKHDDKDIYWFAKGGIYDSPYGSWRNNASRPGDLCSTGSNKVAGPNNGGYVAYAHYTAEEPRKSIDKPGGVSCSNTSNDGMNCTMDKAGKYTVDFDFNSTKGEFWVGVAKGGGSCIVTDSNNANVSGQRIRYTITVSPPPPAPNKNPSMTSLTSTGSCTVGKSHTISMKATDPDGDKIRYLIDWDANGSVDQFVPSSGYVNSGTSRTANRTYSESGKKTMKVRVQDKEGALSSWSTLSFTCSNPPKPPPPPPPPPPEEESQCADGIDNDGDGLIDFNDPDCEASDGVSEFSSGPIGAQFGPADISIRAVPSLVRSGHTTKVTWGSSNVNLCLVTGDNSDSWSGLASPVGGQVSTPIVARTIYSLACLDLSGETVTKTATVNIVPTWREI